MRIGFGTGLLVRCCSVVGVAALTACHASYFNPGRVQSMSLGTLAGVYHRVNGRWPADLAELSHTPCPDFEKFPDEAPGGAFTAPAAPPPAACKFAARFPYEVRMSEVSANLRVAIHDAAGRKICRMIVIVPPANPGTKVTPLVQIKFPVFGCPGGGK